LPDTYERRSAMQEKRMPDRGMGGQPDDLHDGRWREPPETKVEPGPPKQKPGLAREPSLNPSTQRQERHISD
jgi:hypothetical protein